MSEQHLMTEVNPLKLHGVNPSSPHSELFVNIFNVTKPSSEFIKNYKPNIRSDTKSDDNWGHYLERDRETNCSITPTRLQSGRNHHITYPSSGFGNKDSQDLVQHMSKVKVITYNDNSASPQGSRGQDKTKAKGKQSGGNKYNLDVKEQFNMDPSPARVYWLRELMDFMAHRGTPMNYCPTLPGSGFKRPLDLYRLYNLVELYGTGRSPGSCTEVAWNEISELMSVSLDNTSILRKLYGKFLLPYELHQGRGNTCDAEDKKSFQNVSEVNFNLPSPVPTTSHQSFFPSPVRVREEGNWKRNNKKKRMKGGQSVFERLGKKKMH